MGAQPNIQQLMKQAQQMQAKMEEMQRRLFGKKSERLKTSKLPPPLPTKSNAALAARKRAEWSEMVRKASGNSAKATPRLTIAAWSAHSRRSEAARRTSG